MPRSGAWPEPGPEPARWVVSRGRFQLVVGAGVLAYGLMVVGPAVQRWFPFVGEGVLFLPSVVVFVALARIFWIKEPRVPRSLGLATFWYLVVGLLGAVVLAFNPFSPVHPEELGHQLVWAWPTTWLWLYGCSLPFVTTCLG